MLTVHIKSDKPPLWQCVLARKLEQRQAARPQPTREIRRAGTAQDRVLRRLGMHIEEAGPQDLQEA